MKPDLPDIRICLNSSLPFGNIQRKFSNERKKGIKMEFSPTWEYIFKYKTRLSVLSLVNKILS